MLGRTLLRSAAVGGASSAFTPPPPVFRAGQAASGQRQCKTRVDFAPADDAEDVGALKLEVVTGYVSIILRSIAVDAVVLPRKPGRQALAAASASARCTGARTYFSRSMPFGDGRPETSGLIVGRQKVVGMDAVCSPCRWTVAAVEIGGRSRASRWRRAGRGDAWRPGQQEREGFGFAAKGEDRPDCETLRNLVSPKQRRGM